jgi:MFS family permease
MRLVGLLPAAATVLCEAAWVAVVYAVVDTLGFGGQAALGIWPFVAAVAVGMIWARRRLESRRLSWAVAALIALVGALLGGWLEAGPPDLLRPSAGWLVAVAVWRGAVHTDRRFDDQVVAQLLWLGLPALALPWLAGALLDEPRRAAFLGLALPATLLFAASGLVAVGLTRLEALAADTGADWRRNRSWLALLGAVVIGLLVVAIPAALLLGVSLAAMAGLIAGPLAGLAALLGDALGGLVRSIGGPDLQLDLSTPIGAVLKLLLDNIGLTLVVPLALFAALLVMSLRGRAPGPAARVQLTDAPIDEHVFVLPRLRLRLPPLPQLPSRPAPPRTASEAYLRALSAMAGAADLRREQNESPRRHARRVAPLAGWRFALLAADYELERYAQAELSLAETRRAIARVRAASARRPRLPWQR